MKSCDAAAAEAETWRVSGAIRKGMAAMRRASPVEARYGISWTNKRLLPSNSSGLGDIVGRGSEVPCGGCDSLRWQNRAAVVRRKRGLCWRRWPLSVAPLAAPEVQEPAWSEREQHGQGIGLFPDGCRETEDELARALPKVRELVRESAWSVPHASVAKVAKHSKVSTGQMR